MFNNFCEKHYNAAFGLKVLASIAVAACAISVTGPIALAGLLCASGILLDLAKKGWETRNESKQNSQLMEFQTPRMGRA